MCGVFTMGSLLLKESGVEVSLNSLFGFCETTVMRSSFRVIFHVVGLFNSRPIYILQEMSKVSIVLVDIFFVSFL